MSNTVIKIDSLSKQYRLGVVGAGTIRGDFQRWTSKLLGKEDPYLKIGQENVLDQMEGEYVWALKDINLEVKQGEVLGIIGKNGAGKSTLLKILSRVTGPTEGSVKLKGRIASLLEVGTGFHPELTGRENIFLNGAILGMKKDEIKSKLEEIVDFAGVAKYIDTPVKRYSSGMHVRLAFAVAAHLDPEILVVDEVLAVGDAEFQKKAIGKMKDVSNKSGRTILFVSHNMASIKQLSSETILLKEGNLSLKGPTNYIIEEYLAINRKIDEEDLSKRKDRIGNGLAKIFKVLLWSNNKIVNSILIGNPACFELHINSKEKLSNVDIVLSIYNISGVLITSTSTLITSNRRINLNRGNNKITCCFSSIPLQIGRYYVNLAINMGSEQCDWIEHAFHFDLLEDNFYKTGKINQKSRSLVMLDNIWHFD